MLNIVKLVESINDSRTVNGNTAVLESIEEYDFCGLDCISAMMEANTVLASDMSDITEFSVNTDELMVEAASSNPDRLYILTENIGKSFLDAIKNFFMKAAGIAKGLFNRIGVALTKLTGRIDKWSAAMEGKIANAKKDPKKSGFKYTMWNYNTEMIYDKLIAVSDEIGSKYMNIDDVANIVKEHVSKLSSATVDKDGVHVDGKDINDASNKAEADNLDNDLLSAVKTAFGGKARITINAADINGLNKALETAIYGDKKIEENIQTKCDSMLDAIKKSKDTLKTLKERYQKHSAALSAAAKELENASKNFNGFSDSSGDNNSNSAAIAAVKKSLENDVKRVKGYLSVVNTISASNVKAVNSMTTDYMMALSAFVGGVKAPKENNTESKNTETKPEEKTE